VSIKHPSGLSIYGLIGTEITASPDGKYLSLPPPSSIVTFGQRRIQAFYPAHIARRELQVKHRARYSERPLWVYSVEKREIARVAIIHQIRF
jgi:hypothetical protein